MQSLNEIKCLQMSPKSSAVAMTYWCRPQELYQLNPASKRWSGFILASYIYRWGNSEFKGLAQGHPCFWILPGLILFIYQDASFTNANRGQPQRTSPHHPGHYEGLRVALKMKSQAVFRTQPRTGSLQSATKVQATKILLKYNLRNWGLDGRSPNSVLGNGEYSLI